MFRYSDTENSVYSSFTYPTEMIEIYSPSPRTDLMCLDKVVQISILLFQFTVYNTLSQTLSCANLYVVFHIFDDRSDDILISISDTNIFRDNSDRFPNLGKKKSMKQYLNDQSDLSGDINDLAALTDPSKLHQLSQLFFRGFLLPLFT